MILCPIALTIGCRKCAIVRVCPVKTVIGDYKPEKPATRTARRGKGSSTRR